MPGALFRFIGSALLGVLCAGVFFFASPVPTSADGFITNTFSSDSNRLGDCLPLARTDRSYSTVDDLKSTNCSAALQYWAENLLHSRTAGHLSTDIHTNGDTRSLAVPVRARRHVVVFGVSSYASDARLFSDDKEYGSDISCGSHSTRLWTGCTFGHTGIVLSEAATSVNASGTSTYPQHVFGVLGGQAGSEFALSDRDTSLQLLQSLGKKTDIQVKFSSGRQNDGLDFSGNSDAISIPSNLHVAQESAGLRMKISRKTTAAASYAVGKGDGCNNIMLDGSPVGELDTGTDFTRYELGLQIDASPRTTWYVGGVYKFEKLSLDGLGIQGQELGINLRPFNQQINFNGSMKFSDRFLDVGMRHELSKRWQFGADYKLALVKSGLYADYVGAGFFNLLSISGTYFDTPFSTIVHEVGLSATYREGPVTTVFQINQLIPGGSTGGSSSRGSGSGISAAPGTRSTGGTNISLSCGYSF